MHFLVQPPYSYDQYVRLLIGTRHEIDKWHSAAPSRAGQSLIELLQFVFGELPNAVLPDREALQPSDSARCNLGTKRGHYVHVLNSLVMVNSRGGSVSVFQNRYDIQNATL